MTRYPPAPRPWSPGPWSPCWRGALAAVVLVVALAAGPAAQTIDIDRTDLPEAALRPVRGLNVRGADLRDVLRAIGAEAGLNVVVDDAIDARVTVSLEGISAVDALAVLARDNGLTLTQVGTVFRVRGPGPPPPAPVRVELRGNALSVDVDGADVGAVARAVTEATGTTVVVAPGVTGPVTSYVQDAPFEAGLRAVFEGNGFVLRQRGGVYTVEPGRRVDGAPALGAVYGVERGDDGLYALELRDADVAEAVREIARLSPDPGVVTYTLPQSRRVTLRASGLELEEALQALLRGTGTSFRREGSLVVVGTREADGIEQARLIPLGYVRVSDVFDLLPPQLVEGLVVNAVPGQNAVLALGPNDRVAAVEAFLRTVDVRAPQIYIEALVVDFLDTDVFEAGLTFGRGFVGGDSLGGRLPSGYVLDGVGSGAYEASGDGRDGNRVLDALGDAVGIGTLGRLPADFYYRLRVLELEGKVEVRSRPHISTLNGRTASISVGTTQYFLLEQTTPIVGGNQVIAQTTQRFEKIEANVTLAVTPFVGPSGEITADIRPQFSQPLGDFTAGVPPTISTRTVESTVRLRDGETIILGGLIEDREFIDDRKVPILGDIPLLGRLFRSTVRERRRSELVIYLTPYVFYGDGRDEARWRAIADRQGLTDPEGAGLLPNDDR